MLPGGRAVLYTSHTGTGGSYEGASIVVQSLPNGPRTVLLQGGYYARYVASGHLVYLHEGTLFAVPFDLDRLEVVGQHAPVLEGVTTGVTNAGAQFAVSENGTLVYLPGGSTLDQHTLVWVDRQGREAPIPAPARAYLYPRISPDGTRVALDIRDQENDIWMWDLGRQTLSRVTFEAGLDSFPVWAPDGRRLFFGSSRAGLRNVFWTTADGTGTAERLTQSTSDQVPTSASPDGTRVVLRDQTATGAGSELMMLLLNKDRVEPPAQGVGAPGGILTSDLRPLVHSGYVEDNAEISPDGRFIAYESNSSGQFEIYVRPFPNVDSGLWQVSTAGGTRPLWARNGQELFYVSPMGALMSVPIERGAAWAAGTPTKLFERPYFTAGTNTGRSHDVSPGGRRFLMIGNDQAGVRAATQITIVFNWIEELKRLVPVQ